MEENIESLIPLFKNEQFAFNFAIQNHLLYQCLYCDRCNSKMYIVTDNSKKFCIKWFCFNCKRTQSILYGSVFYGAKLSISKVFYLIYCWLHELQCCETAHEVGVHIDTVTYYFTLFRNACDSYVISSNVSQIGGPGKTVQIDETLICRRKFNVGRMLNQVWVFGGVCIDDKNFFCIVIPNRKIDVLEKEIRNYILPGTTIVSDCWKAYKFLDECDGYEHLSVNHSKNFINPDNYANTQTIERMWLELKQINKKYRGIPRSKINEHISEFIWRYNILDKSRNKFQAALELIANTQFLKVEDVEEI